VVIGQEHFLDSLGMLTCLSDPVDDGVLFVPFSPYQATDPISLSNMRQGIDDLIVGCAAAIEERPFGFRKGLPTRLALVPLAAGFGPAQFDHIELPITLELAVVWTDFIWTKVSHLSQFPHLALLPG
jgi:hypothetical protein